MSKCVVCLLVCLNVGLNYVQCSNVLYSDCILTSTSQQGKCVKYLQCPNVATPPQICGHLGYVVVICCPIGNLPSDLASGIGGSSNLSVLKEQKPFSKKKYRSLEKAAGVQKGQKLPVGELSKQKCKEYDRLSETIIFDPVLMDVDRLVKNDHCNMHAETLIVDGTKAEPKEFPHMALLGWGPKDQLDFKCGGSIISEYFILTATHCLESETYPSYVLVGDLDISTSIDDARPQLLRIELLFPHPKRDRTKAKYYDIALVRTSSPIHLNPYVRPACLYTYPNSPTRFVATGWGRTSFVGAKSDHLLKVALIRFSYKECNLQFANYHLLPKGIIRSQTCAGSKERGDTCGGDSGGPLQIKNNYTRCMYDIVGITSFGEGCGKPNVSAIYTNVFSFLEWIEDLVWPNGN